MPKVALWRVIEEGKPARLQEHGDFLEKHLETWIEQDPSLALDGLRWVGRQVILPDSTRLDLLGLTREGQWVVAELKSGPVTLATLTQVLHYAMQIGSMDAGDLLSRLTIAHDDLDDMMRLARNEPASPRPILLLLVGTSRTDDLERGMRFLEKRGLDLQVRVVTYNVFKHPDGGVLLARDVEEQDEQGPARSPMARSSAVERVLGLAGQHGVREELESAVSMAERLGLRVKAWPLSITINSPANWRKTLLYLAPEQAAFAVGYSAESLDEAFGPTEAEVRAALGPNWRTISKAEAPKWLRSAEALLLALQARSKATK